MIAGFQTPTKGKLLIRGRDMHAVPPNRRPVNLVFQNLALFPMMNVRENIASYGDKNIDQLSGGQKQRVVAIALS